MVKKRAKHSAAFKAKVALKAVREQAPMTDIARKYKVHANVVYKWKRQLLDNLAAVFETEARDCAEASEREAELLRKIGELTVERDFFVQRARSIEAVKRRAMVDSHASISVRRQCELMVVSCSGLERSHRPPRRRNHPAHRSRCRTPGSERQKTDGWHMQRAASDG